MGWSEIFRNPLNIAQLHIVPLRTPLALKTGGPLPIQVFFRGKPVPGVEIEGPNHKVVAITPLSAASRPNHRLSTVECWRPAEDDPF